MASKKSTYFTENLIPFNEPLSKEFLMKKAAAELNETEENRREGLAKLRKLIKEHNVHCITTDEFLLRFLRTKKFKIQRSFDAIRLYSNERASVHDLISKLRPEVLESILRNKIFGILPYRDYEGRIIGYIKEGNWKDSICTHEECVIYGFAVICYAVEDEGLQINGGHVLLEESSFNLRNALIGIQHLYVRRNFLFKGAPIRYARTDVMNEPAHVGLFIKLVKSFLPEKIKKRIFIHGKRRDDLFKHVPQCLLPDESESESASSTADPLINEELIEIMKGYLKKVQDDQRYFLGEESDQ